MTAALGSPRLHFRVTDSTNLRARELALRGTPHGTLVTAGEQSAGRGRQGRTWSAPAGSALLCSLVLRDPPRLLPLAAGVAVAEAADAAAMRGERARIKWPNDVLLAGRKLAGILVEGRPQERWAVLGIGLNVAVRLAELPAELRDQAATLALDPAAIEPVLEDLLVRLAIWLEADAAEVLDAVRARDTLLGRRITWSAGTGRGAGIDEQGRLLVSVSGGAGGPVLVALDAGEVHLDSSGL